MGKIQEKIEDLASTARTLNPPTDFEFGVEANLYMKAEIWLEDVKRIYAAHWGVEPDAAAFESAVLELLAPPPIFDIVQIHRRVQGETILELLTAKWECTLPYAEAPIQASIVVKWMYTDNENPRRGYGKYAIIMNNEYTDVPPHVARYLTAEACKLLTKMWEENDSKPTEVATTSSSSTDCREEDGITVGLVDTIITAARCLRQRDLSPVSVQEALKDLGGDEDVRHILK